MSEPTKIAVAGATGRIGHPLVEVLTMRGHEVVPISRSHGVDVITGEGLDAALDGVAWVVDAATGPSAEQGPATEFFTTAARNLGQAGHRAGVENVVLVSIVGIEAFVGGYGAAKIDHEKAYLEGPVPTKIVRATQFHEFVEQLVQWGTQGDVAYVQRMRTQPVAARAVAEVIGDIVEGTGPSGLPHVDVAGPKEESLVELAKLFVARRGLPLSIEPVSNPDDPATPVFEGGALLPGPSAIITGPTFEEWLDAN